MPTILSDKSQEIVFQKSSQMAISTYCILWTIWLCKFQLAKRGVIYWLPTDGDMRDFVNGKVDPFIAENDELNWARQESIDKKRADNLGLKFLYNIPTYWRGIKSKSAVKTISADADIFDEYDEAEPGQIKQAEQRLSFSSIKLRRRLSVPTIPEFGINKAFLETDQCHFKIKCTGCSTWNCVEENFPECFKQKGTGDYYLACKKCSRELNSRNGQWIKKNPGSDIRGYQISQLYSPFITPNEIMQEYQTTEFMGHFYNHVLGLPHLNATDKVSKEQVLNLCSPNMIMPTGSESSTFMGIDQGAKLHCVIMQKGTIDRILWIGELMQFEEVDNVMRRFNVRECVIDALPETRKARELKDRMNKVWLCFYNDNQKGSYAWNDHEKIVQVNRTESLDVGTLGILEKRLSLPQRSKDVEEFALHCSNIAKVTEEDKVTGSKKYVYRKIGPDHYRHALNYAQIAAARYRSGPIISVFR